MPLTAYSILFGTLAMLGAWLAVAGRAKKSPTPTSPQVRMLQGFFLHMGLFQLCMFAPQILLTTNPERFPEAMAWGYVIGHIFCYVALTYLFCLTFSMIPKLATKMKFPIIFGVVANVAMTVLTTVTMVYGTQPSYDATGNVTMFNAHPMVGGLIGAFVLLAMAPTMILFFMNGIHNTPARTRSFLLSTGLLLMIFGGPLHDLARTWQLYAVADTLTGLGFIVMAAAIIYRFEDRIVSHKLPQSPSHRTTA